MQTSNNRDPGWSVPLGLRLRRRMLDVGSARYRLGVIASRGVATTIGRTPVSRAPRYGGAKITGWYAEPVQL